MRQWNKTVNEQGIYYKTTIMGLINLDIYKRRQDEKWSTQIWWNEGGMSGKGISLTNKFKVESDAKKHLASEVGKLIVRLTAEYRGMFAEELMFRIPGEG
jgi:hypothetical protein